MINFVRGWKFIGGFLLIISASLILWVLTITLSPEAKQAREARAVLEQLQEEYKNDTFGGQTPEETLELFIAALEDGDIELASKYFLPEDREKIMNDIKSTEEAGKLSAAIERFKNLRLSSKNNKRAFFKISDENGMTEFQATLDKNPNGVWKISDI